MRETESLKNENPRVDLQVKETRRGKVRGTSGFLGQGDQTLEEGIDFLPGIIVREPRPDDASALFQPQALRDGDGVKIPGPYVKPFPGQLFGNLPGSATGQGEKAAVGVRSWKREGSWMP